jgi:hypothetical protein
MAKVNLFNKLQVKDKDKADFLKALAHHGAKRKSFPEFVPDTIPIMEPDPDIPGEERQVGSADDPPNPQFFTRNQLAKWVLFDYLFDLEYAYKQFQENKKAGKIARRRAKDSDGD